MSTTIYRNDLKITENSVIKRKFSVIRFARKNGESCKCGYQISIGDQQVTLDAMQMREYVDSLKVFFYSEGYP